MKRSSFSVLICVLFILGIMFTSQLSGEDKSSTSKTDKKSEITVELRLSVESYDPVKPAGNISCVVNNGSKNAIKLPANYDGRTIVLYGIGRGHRGASNLWRPRRVIGDEKSKSVTIAPGEKSEIFDLPLAELLTPMSGKERRWAWDWKYRFEPPRTPIHTWRKIGYVETADFFAEIRIADSRVVSKKVVLTVRSGDSKKRDNVEDGNQAEDNTKRAQLWKALLKACPKEYRKIEVYGENTELTQVLFRSSGTTLLFSSKTGKVEPVNHMKKIRPVNRITYRKHDRGGVSFILWYNGDRELTVSVGE